MGFDKEDVSVEGKKDNIADHYGMEVVSLDNESCEMRMKVRDDCLNYHGTLHGALYYAMADMCTGILAHTDDRAHVTLSGNLNFLRPVSSGYVYARSSFEHSGRTTSVLNVHIYDEKDNLLASGNYTFYCLGDGNNE